MNPEEVMVKVTPGERVRWARIQKGYTLKELGTLLGYQGRSVECAIQNWEHNRTPIPIKHFRKLSEILEIPLEQFIP